MSLSPLAHLRLENRHTGEVLELRRQTQNRERILSLRGTLPAPRGVSHRWWNQGDQPLAFEGRARPVVDLDRHLQAIFEVVNAGAPNRPSLFYLAHVALRHRRTQTVFVMPPPLLAILFRVLIVLGTILGRYRGTEWPGCPKRCTGAPDESRLERE